MPIIQIGSHRVTGRPAAAILLALLLGIVGSVVYFRPAFGNWPLWASVGLWIAFIAYWNSAARNSASVRSAETAKSRALHQNLMILSLLLLFIPIPGLRSRFLPPAPLWTPIGLAVQCAFFALAVWARRHLGRNWSGAISIKVDHRLITSGPYRLVRHPIYTAMLGMFAGAAIVSGQWHALLAVVLITVAYWRKIRLEEQPLHETFGDAWVAYRARTRALIPWLL
jgi:protein-S-isoprenylcysteine O-methyltransferase Ste14